MASSYWVCLVAVLAAFSGATLLSAYAVETFERTRLRTASVAFGQGQAGVLAHRLRNGYALFKPVAEKLQGIALLSDSANELVDVARARGYTTDEDSCLSVLLVWTIPLTAVSGICVGGLFGGVAVAGAIWGIAVCLLKTRRDRRIEAVREQVPDALRIMGVCFDAGFSLLQTFQYAHKELEAPMSDVFARAAHVLETGGTVTSALSEIRKGATVPELTFVSLALEVRHITGGSASDLLAFARESIENELALARDLRVQTAQARLSARIVTIMPFLLVALFTLFGGDFIGVFFESVEGMLLLAVALVMQLAGVLSVRRIVGEGGAR